MLALPDAARCRSLRAAPRADDLCARSCGAVGLSEVQEGGEATGCDTAPANTAPAIYTFGRLFTIKWISED